MSDYGAFRDLQRHRMLTLDWQELTARHGCAPPPEAVAEVGALADWQRVMDGTAELHERPARKYSSTVAQYAVSMACLIRFYMRMNAREAMHAIELRTSRQGDLIRAGSRLRSADALRRVIDLPPELDGADFATDERRRIDEFLHWARGHGADRAYVARHRRAWWSVGLKAPAPILCTYMARRPPQFTLNACGARHINIAHGLYPRQPLGARVLDGVVS